MTKKEKQLLLKDLCARLPYGVFVEIEDEPKTPVTFEWKHLNFLLNWGWIIKPYLRPMSSMTEEEKKAYRKTQINKWVKCVDCTGGGYYEHRDTLKTFDWLNAHHFDYRGLIEKGLALEAPKEMYKLNN